MKSLTISLFKVSIAQRQKLSATSSALRSLDVFAVPFVLMLWTSCSGSVLVVLRMADVKCTICGDRGHVASDCKQAAEKHQKAKSTRFFLDF